MEQYCIYLRKSRTDAEAEAQGEGETLARHEKTLLSLARKLCLPIQELYREMVSGETISARPVMQRLLSEVEQGIWNGVLVMEVERLARGDTIDQGIVARTFKYSGTKIITPLKIYDPSNEFDEEYFEFGLFMSRREYKTINRRLQQGRMASAKEGKYVANSPPYGYLRKKLSDGKGYTLEPHPEQAPVVSMIFALYTQGENAPDGTKRRIGATLIARKLNAMGIPASKGGLWSANSIRDMLKNPVYIGKIRWNARPVVKKMTEGLVVTTRPRASPESQTLTDGLHQAIVEEAVFKAAQAYRNTIPSMPLGKDRPVKNPLGGLVFCGKCGRSMVRRPYPKGQGRPDTVICPNPDCGNISVSLNLLENRILSALSKWLSAYKIHVAAAQRSAPYGPEEQVRKTLKNQEAILFSLEKQHNRLCCFLEEGIYSKELFLERSRLLKEKTETAKKEYQALSAEMENVRRESKRRWNGPDNVQLCDLYWMLPTAGAKNALLKQLLNKVIYIKEISGRWHHSPDEFELFLYPHLPKESPVPSSTSPGK
ncbi:MAG: recombinase family protein [Oscillospiraceae bacterium]|nr:recombinase family protein [Oscillospiraceae bacterium]